MAEVFRMGDGSFATLNDQGELVPFLENPTDTVSAADAAVAAEYRKLNPATRAQVAFRSRVAAAASGAEEAAAEVVQVGGELFNSVLAAPFDVELTDTADALRTMAEQRRAETSVARGQDEGVAGIVGGAPIDLAFARFRMLGAIAGESSLAALEAEPGQRAGRAIEAAAGGFLGEGIGRGLGAAFDFGRAAVRRAGEATQEAAQEYLPEVVSDFLRQKPGDIVGRMAAIGNEVAKLKTLADDLVESGGAAWRELVRKGDQLGFMTSPGMRTRNVQRQQLEASLARNPLTSGPWADLQAHNERLMAEHINAALGVDGDAVTPQALDVAQGIWSKQFDDVAEALGDNVFADQPAVAEQLLTDLRAAASRESRDITRAAGPGPARRALDAITAAVREGEVSGRRLMAWRSNLVGATREQAHTASEKLAAGDMIDHLDQAIEAVAGREVGSTYRDARLRYRFWKVITDASQSAVETSGEVSARRLAGQLRAEYGQDFRLDGLTGFRPGRSAAEQAIANAFDSIRWGSTVGHDVVPNSGTPTGLFVNSIMEQGLQGVPTLSVRFAAGEPVSRAALALPSAAVRSSSVRQAGGVGRAVVSAAAESDDDDGL